MLLTPNFHQWLTTDPGIQAYLLMGNLLTAIFAKILAKKVLSNLLTEKYKLANMSISKTGLHVAKVTCPFCNRN